jgi:hypothetical protein
MVIGGGRKYEEEAKLLSEAERINRRLVQITYPSSEVPRSMVLDGGDI